MTIPDTFTRLLADYSPTPNTVNPYRDPDLSNNLSAYIALLSERPGPRILLVGEALGYRGGSQTGIPFSSTHLLRRAPHRFLRGLKPHLQLSGNDKEGTASALWQFLAGRQRIPLCWNAYPFHPHRPGEPNSNRGPNARELGLGLEILGQLMTLYRPEAIIAVGNAAGRATGKMAASLPTLQVRHPSYGGRREFLDGMAAAYRRQL